jgi:Mg-chelatase subunit ChlD
LSDLVRHLRQDDEVFVMGFSQELEFEQDLTRNEKLLEEAIANLKPQPGAALLDAVAFAAGHLDRIAKNRSRVLLVISDGRDAAAHVSSSEINVVLGRVRVDCIGVDVDDAAGMNLLQSLASYSGGQTSFATSPKQFRAATWEFAKSMGIEFPY